MPSGDSSDDRITREVTASVFTVAEDQKRDGLVCLEAQHPARACAIVHALASGDSMMTIRREFKVGQRMLVRLKESHRELLRRTRHWRMESSIRLRAKAAEALEAKLDDVLEDDALRAKTPVKDLALGYAITSDKERDARGEGRVVTVEHKVSIEDAQQALQAARKRIEDAKKEIEI